jgi:hypothetical protein
LKKLKKLAYILAIALVPGIPMLSLPTGFAHAKAATPAAANYKTIKAALKKELRELNAQLNSALIQGSLKQLKTHLDNARKVELDYRAAIDQNKSEAEKLILANSWSDYFQPAYDILSDLSINLGLEESEIEQKLAALKAVPSRYANDRRDIERLMGPYLELKELVSKAGKYVGPIQDALFSVTQNQALSDAEIEAAFSNELARILNSRIVARE